MPLGPPSAMTKYQPPTPVSSWVDRSRLTHILETGMGKRLVLLHGPAGYGKSTLAAQWVSRLARDGARIAWFSLSRDDNNSIWFVSHLIESLLKTGMALDTQLLQLLQERPDDAEKYVVPSIINAIAEDQRRIVVALDDWHRITEPRTRAVVERLLDEGPDNLNVVVTSRSRTGLPLGRLSVRDQLVEIDAASLRFDQGESRQWLVDINHLELSGEDVNLLHASTDGWAAALQLSSLSLRGRNDVSQLVKEISGRHQAIGDYLAENVLDTLEPEVLDFLLSTSITERITADLASTLSGVRRGQAMLEKIQDRDLFLQPLDLEGKWYRYHHLFEEYLRKRLERDAPERLTALHSKAAHWYADNGHISEAVDHALAAGEVDFAVVTVESFAMLQVELSQMSTLLAMVRKLPEDRINYRPRLQMAIAWACCLLHYPAEAGTALEQVEALLGTDQTLNDSEKKELRIEALVVLRCLEMYADQIDPGNDLRTVVLNSELPLRPWIVSVAANIVTYGELQTGRFADALKTQEAAKPTHDQTTGPFSGVYGRCFAGLASLALLDMTAAEASLIDAVELGCNSAGRKAHATRLAGGILGSLYYLRGDFKQAKKLLEEARELGQHGGVVDFMIQTYAALGRLYAFQNDSAGALQTITAGESIARTLELPRLMAHLTVERANLGFAWQTLDQTSFDFDHVSRAVGESMASAELSQSLRSGSSSAIDQAKALLAIHEERGYAFGQLETKLALADALAQFGYSNESQLYLRDGVLECYRADLPVMLSERSSHFLRLLKILHDQLLSGFWEPNDEDGVGRFLSRALTFKEDVNANEAQPSESAILQVEQRLVKPERPLGEPELTEREQEILLLVERGLSNRQIAQELFIGVNTVKWYLKNLFSTLGVESRQQCVSEARQRQLLVSQA